MIRQPPTDLYNRLEEIRQSRTELALLVSVTVILGVLLNVTAGFIFETGKKLATSTIPGWLIFWGLVLLIVILLILVLILIYARGETRAVRLDIVIPYHLLGKENIEVLSQHPYRPPYSAAQQARQLFSRCFPKDGPEGKRLRQEWEDAKQHKPQFQLFIKPLHTELVEALLLMLLHRYAEESLGPEAKYKWWQVELPRKVCKPTHLPPALGSNRFLQAFWNRDVGNNGPGWNLVMPRDVKFTIQVSEKGRRWIFRHRWFGRVDLQLYPDPWLATRASQPVRVLRDGLASEVPAATFVAGSRAEVVASFQLAFLPRSDAFMNWASGLLVYLENGLDWGYFLNSRADRISVDLAWKLGELPEDGSLWKKLEQIEKQQAKLLEEIERLKPPAEGRG